MFTPRCDDAKFGALLLAVVGKPQQEHEIDGFGSDGCVIDRARVAKHGNHRSTHAISLCHQI